MKNGSLMLTVRVEIYNDLKFNMEVGYNMKLNKSECLTLQIPPMHISLDPTRQGVPSLAAPPQGTTMVSFSSEQYSSQGSAIKF